MLAPYRIEPPVDLEQDLAGFEEELTALIIGDESGISHSPHTELFSLLPIGNE